MRGREVVLWVVVLAGVTAESRLTAELQVSSEPQPRVFYIYPRTGRLFRADFARDNEIFRSLERTNFMRRGALAEGLKTTDGEDFMVKKRLFVVSSMIPGGEKKSLLGNVKDFLLKPVLDKFGGGYVKDSEKEKRIKRDTEFDPFGLKESRLKSDQKVDENLKIKNPEKTPTSRGKDTGVGETEDDKLNLEEKEVEGSYSTHPNNNDTDKTLLALDSAGLDKELFPSNLKVPEVSVRGGNARGEELRLYPVYTGVKFTYPRTQRSLTFTPEMTAQLDTPEVSDIHLSENKSFVDDEEGRSRRRRYKKFAFPLLLALKLKAALLLPLILGVISLVAFKGLWSGLTALGVAAALGLKALVGGAPRVVVQAPPPPPLSPHYHHYPPHEYAEYWSRRDDFSDYRPSSWS